jgi:hypothetical protein
VWVPPSMGKRKPRATLYFGVGEQWDESKLRAYPAGTFYSEPSKTPHFVWAKDGEVIIQTTGMGPAPP